MFTDFIIADPSEAEEIANCEEPGSWPRLSIDITDLELIDLTRIMLKRDYEPRLAFGSDEDELFVLEMDPKLRDALATLEGEKLDNVWEKWAETEAFAEISAEDVREALQRLAEFGAQAKQAGKSILQVTVIDEMDDE